VSPAVPVPLKVGVVSLVLPSPMTPVSLILAKAAVGAASGVASMMSGSVVARLVLPDGSVAVMLSVVAPFGKALVGVALQLPLLSTTAVAMVLPLASLMVIVSPAMPVPLRVGVVSLVIPSP